MHNKVCSKKALYDGICRDIKSVLTESREELVSVSLNCKYFVAIKDQTYRENLTNSINRT